MKHYYFNENTDSNGNHEVHTSNCSFLPSELNRTYIGFFSDCHGAILDAMRNYPSKKFDGCYFCSNSCHRG